MWTTEAWFVATVRSRKGPAAGTCSRLILSCFIFNVPFFCIFSVLLSIGSSYKSSALSLSYNHTHIFCPLLDIYHSSIALTTDIYLFPHQRYVLQTPPRVSRSGPAPLAYSREVVTCVVLHRLVFRESRTDGAGDAGIGTSGECKCNCYFAVRF